MSKNWIFLFALIAIGACQSKNEVEPLVNREAVNISFSLEGEIDLESESPMTGRVNGDLGIIYGVTINKKVDQTESFYLEGVFNNLENISAKLFSDESYIIYFSALQDGTGLGPAYETSGDSIVFTHLFGQNSLKLGNKFINNDQLFYLQSNSIAAYERNDLIDNTYSNALVDRFDGKVEVNNPSTDDSVIPIQLRRVSFGLAFRVENIDSNDTLQITLSSTPGSPFDYNLTQTNPQEYQIRTLKDNGFEISDTETVILYSSFNLKVYDDSGAFVREKLLSTQDIIGKRNVKKTYVINLNDFGEGTAGRKSVLVEYQDDNLVDEGEVFIGG